MNRNIRRIFNISITTAIIATIMVSTFITVFAAQTDEYLFVVNKGNVTVTGYKADDAIIQIPYSIEGYPVTRIGGGKSKKISWENSERVNGDWVSARIMGVKIPESVDSLKDAFFGCSKLINTDIPISVITIENSFNECTALKTIALPKSITVLENSFQKCTMLNSIIIPENVSSIDGSFNGCKKLESVIVPNSVTSIRNAFNDCPGLNVVIPNSVSKISNSFKGCTIFGNYESYAREYAINNGVKFEQDENIDKYLFVSEGKKITITKYKGFDVNVKVPGNLGGYIVSKIGKEAFSDSIFNSIKLPYSITSIDDAAFMNCKGLKTVSIPAMVNHLGKGVFQGCTNLLKIEVSKNNKNYVGIGGMVFNKNKNEIIQFPAGMAGIITIPNSVTTISAKSFESCNKITEVFIPKSVTEIGDFAFKNCKRLKIAHFLGNAPQIGEGIFLGCPLDFKIHYIEGKDGFSNPWNEYRATTYVGIGVLEVILIVVVVILLAAGIYMLLYLRKKKKEQ